MRSYQHSFLIVIMAISIATLSSCGSGGAQTTNPPKPQADTAPPLWISSSNLSELERTEDTISLSWEPASDTVDSPDRISYKVYYGIDSEPFDDEFQETGKGATSKVVSGLKAGTKYFFGIRPVDSSGNVGPKSTVISASTLAIELEDSEPPTWPGSPGIADVEPGDGKAVLTWNAANDNVTSGNRIKYRVFVSQSDKPFASSPSETSAGATTWTATNLENDVTYYFCVRAGDEAGNWETNTTVLSSTPTGKPVIDGDSTPPSWSSNPGVENLEPLDSAVKVSWKGASDDVDSSGSLVYRVYFGNDSDPFDDEYLESLPGAKFLTVTGLDNEVEYFFAVRARDTSGNWDDNQHVVSAIPVSSSQGDVEPPVWQGAPGVQLVEAGDEHIMVYWNPALDNHDNPEDIWYRVYYDTDPNPFDQEMTVVTDLNVFEKGLGGLSNGTTYYIGVRTRDQSGNWDDNEVVMSCTPQISQYETTLTIIDICADELTDLDLWGIDDEDEVFLQVYWQVNGELQGTMRWPPEGHWSLQRDESASNHCVAQQTTDLSRKFMVPRNGELVIGVQIIEEDDWGVNEWNQVVGQLIKFVDIPAPWLATMNDVINAATVLGIDLHNSNDVIGSFQFTVTNNEGHNDAVIFDENLHQCTLAEWKRWEAGVQEIHYRFNGDGSMYPTWWRIQQTSN